MAPEEFTLGATIDQQTTLFTLGRMAAIFLGDGTLVQKPFRESAALHEVVVRACATERRLRFAAIAAFADAWTAACYNQPIESEPNVNTNNSHRQ